MAIPGAGQCKWQHCFTDRALAHLSSGCAAQTDTGPGKVRFHADCDCETELCWQVAAGALPVRHVSVLLFVKGW